MSTGGVRGRRNPLLYRPPVAALRKDFSCRFDERRDQLLASPARLPASWTIVRVDPSMATRALCLSGLVVEEPRRMPQCSSEQWFTRRLFCCQSQVLTHSRGCPTVVTVSGLCHSPTSKCGIPSPRLVASRATRAHPRTASSRTRGSPSWVRTSNPRINSPLPLRLKVPSPQCERVSLCQRAGPVQ